MGDFLDLKDAGIVVRRHIKGAICRTCVGIPKDGEWVFAQSETGTLEWHRGCSTKEYQALFDAAVAKLEAR